MKSGQGKGGPKATGAKQGGDKKPLDRAGQAKMPGRSGGSTRNVSGGGKK